MQIALQWLEFQGRSTIKKAHRMNPIHPTPEALAALAASPSSGPVVMLNLLKFKRGGGSKAYARYSDAFQEVLERAGGRFVYLGRATELLISGEDWDAVALVQYPSRKVFLELIATPEYTALARHRDEGLERTVLYATEPRIAPAVPI